ncbi:MAG: FMN-binding negative transcriptional regulator [Hoeflea sp.]|uniref:FMN-binding negative transcriptional regulator n=1 Tax=Hoeflea sp. TaxID=1940281 RepID=UPI001D2FA49B|nr:FMN-binding negative transcriptional regulator [Hoeflea sp.]MBU4531602.1 FMN-binding negative transcriptional regulator [Alphaproteobacteria bacterium]MBU4544459.1 FMN-binding negative transcriptional regulator [Alphaproteobacteria bacterium]MBU4552690.1 FMN-binding negative transcriptional regulator [Alphaproteobacteria bacterium]MBV1724878.1 FMN-binding negative transcriptional regulator [Hoeflea sp.]MBV1760898.1 FMN-binding negative transcriptional regulator [Hoeflea sp.]
MYVPPHFAETDETAMRALIAAHPLGLLISSSATGVLANPVPFLVSVSNSVTLLRAHLARANEQWRHVRDGAEVLVVFQGAQTYVTPSWYAAKAEHGKVVPTWNYAMVQARGSVRVHEGSDWLRPQVGELTDTHEAGRPEPWKVDDAPDAFVAAQLRGIVGIEITVRQLTGKWKVSQNRQEADRHGVHAGLTRDAEDEMAKLVALYGGLADR